MLTMLQIWSKDNVNSPELIGPIATSVVANLTIMRTGTVTNGGLTYLQGHTGLRGLGSGYFTGVTGAAVGTYTDNNSTTIVPTGGDGSAAWIRDPSENIDFHTFGALGGGADDTIPINAFFSYVIAQGGGFYVLPKGTFLCDNAVMTQIAATPIGNQITIMGYGTILGPFTASPTSGAILTITALDVWTNLKIFGIDFMGGFDHLVLDGGLSASGSKFYKFALVDISSRSHTNEGITIKGHAFEYVVERPYMAGATGAVSNLHIIDTVGATPGDITILEPNSRGGTIGIKIEPSHYKVFGGTVIQADTYGMSVSNSIGAVIEGTHFENNWESANDPTQPAWLTATAYVIGNQVNNAGTTYTALTDHTSTVFATDLANGDWSMDGGAGLFASNSATLIGIRGTTLRNQKYIIELFSNNSAMVVIGGSYAGNTFRFAAVRGNGTFRLDTTNYEITANSPRIIGEESYLLPNVIAYAATITPELTLGAGVSVASQTGNITINAPLTRTLPDAAPLNSRLSFLIFQDATGGRTVTFNAVYKGLPTPVLAPGTEDAANQANYWEFIKITSTQWRCINFRSSQ